jgi:hypothetical protein
VGFGLLKRHFLSKNLKSTLLPDYRRQGRDHRRKRDKAQVKNSQEGYFFNVVSLSL